MSEFNRILLFLGSIAIVGCMIHNTHVNCDATSSSSVSIGSGSDSELKIRRAIDVTADRDITSLNLDVPYSNIAITSGPTVHRLRITGYVREKTQNESAIEFTSNGPRLVTHSTPPARYDGLLIEVPPGTPLIISSASGQVSAHNLSDTASVELKSSYGNLELQDCGAIPTIRLITASGAITMKSVRSFHNLTAESSYGNVKLTSLNGDAGATLDATAASGSVAMSDIHSAQINAKSGYGNVTLEDSSDVAASLASGSGQVKAAALERAGDLTLRTAYGNADIKSIPHAGAISAHCDSGTVTVTDTASPSASLSTAYGNITLRHCAFAALNTQCLAGRLSQENVQVGNNSLK